MQLLLRALIIWLCIIALETLHGITRTLTLQKWVGDFRARQIAVFTGYALIQILVNATSAFLHATSTRECVLVGAVWVIWTVMFEIGLGRLVIKASWARILSDYDLRNGGLMPIGLVLLACSPYFAKA